MNERPLNTIVDHNAPETAAPANPLFGDIQPAYTYPDEEIIRSESPERQYEAAPLEAPVAQANANLDDKMQNITNLRKRAEQAEQRARALEQAMVSRMQDTHNPYAQQYQQQPQRAAVPESLNIGDEDIVEGKTIKKLMSNFQLALEEQRQSFQAVANKLASTETESKIRNRYKDIDSVVNDDKVADLMALYPEDREILSLIPDPRARAVVAYNMIKERGLVSNDMAQIDRKLAENKSKFKPAASAAPKASESSLARAGQYDRRTLTEQRRAEIREHLRHVKQNS